MRSLSANFFDEGFLSSPIALAEGVHIVELPEDLPGFFSELFWGQIAQGVFARQRPQRLVQTKIDFPAMQER